MGRLEGKVAVVTGGGNGIGRACCERFAEEGADVVVADLLEAAGAETVAAVEGHGRKAVFVRADATSAADNETTMQTAVDTFGALDVVVTAAGISHAGYRSDANLEDELQRIAEGRTFNADLARGFVELPFEEWRQVLDVNLTGTFLALQSAARRMLDAGRGGSLITIASIAAKVPEAGTPSYGVSKAGVWMLTKQASRALAPEGIRVNAIGPGFIETNMTRIIHEVPETEARIIGTIPMGRMGTPREIANTALFLASDESSYFTGEILHPDGGFYTE
ncbi:MAG TPA: SDR family oxidoreductase [Acidimicrobiia bacterium]|nr:SDR family oxidoreductase [Acidimicrobiia bacterium]